MSKKKISAILSSLALFLMLNTWIGAQEKKYNFGFSAGAGLTFYLPKLLPLGLNLRAFVQVLGAQTFGYSSSYGGVVEVGGYNLIWGIDLGLKYRF